jgi:hypothetical protein
MVEWSLARPALSETPPTRRSTAGD